MGEVLCSTENSPFLIIDHIHAKMNRVCCAALAIGKKCMNVRKNKLFKIETNTRQLTKMARKLPPYVEYKSLKRTVHIGNVCLFLLRLNGQVNNISVISGQNHRFLSITSTFGDLNVLLKNTTRRR